MSKSYFLNNNTSHLAHIDVATISGVEDKIESVTASITDQVTANSKKIKTNRNEISRTRKKLLKTTEKVDRIEKQVNNDYNALAAIMYENTSHLSTKMDNVETKHNNRFKWLIGSICGTGVVSLGALVLQIIEMCLGG